jgi:hypothetical protein
MLKDIGREFYQSRLSRCMQITETYVAIENFEGTRERVWFYVVVALTVLLVIVRTNVNPDPKHTKN